MSRRTLAAGLAAALALGVLVGTAPGAVAIPAPALSSSTLDADGDIRLSWLAEPGATGYTVQVGSHPGFEASTVLMTVQTVNTVLVPQVPFANEETRTLYWRVAAHTSGTTSTSRGEFSAPASFDVTRSATPTLLAPTQGSVLTYPTAVSFRWTTVPGAASYTLEYSSNPDFAADATLESVTTTATSHTPASPMARTADNETITWFWRVRANFFSGTSTAVPGPASGPRSFSIDWPANQSAPQLLSPANWDGTAAVSDVQFRWQRVPGAASYRVIVGSSKDATGTLVAGVIDAAGGTTTATTFVPTVALLDRNYFWQVIAYDTAGNAGAPSTIWEFVKKWGAQTGPTGSSVEPLAYPVAHVGGTTVEGAEEVSIHDLELSWSPVPRATLYDVEVVPLNGDARLTCRTASTSATIIATSVGGSGTPGALKGAGPCMWSATKGIKPGFTYRWRVRAVDYSGAATTTLQAPVPTGSLVSAWSDPEQGDESRARYVRVTAGDTSSAAAVPDVEAFEQQKVPALQGQPAPVFDWSAFPGATGYEVTVALNQEMTNQVVVARTPSTRLRLNGVFDNNETGLPYYWRVRPFHTPNWTTTFTYLDDSSAVTPEWRKIGRSTDVVGVTPVQTSPDGTVLLSWRPQAESAPLDGGSRGYLVAIANSSGTSQGVAKVEYPFFVASRPATGQPLSPGNYTFTVAPLDANGNPGRASAPQGFTISAPAPVPGSALVGSAGAVLRWTPTAAATRFEVQYWNDATPATKLLTGGTTTRQAALSIPELAPGAYSWQVLSVDAGGNKSAWSQVATMTVAERPVTMRTPDGSVLPTRTRVLDWAPVTGASRYLVQVATTPGGVETAPVVETTATSLAPTGAMQFGPTYYWRVRAVAERFYGSTSARPVLGTSATRQVSTRTLPSAPSVSGPVVDGAGLSVSWTPLSGTTAGTDSAQVVYLVRYRVKAVPENPWTTLAPTSAGVSSLLLTGLQASTVYEVGVAARTPEGQGPWSVTRERSTATPPTAPTSVTATPGNRSLTVTWRAASTTAGAPVTGYVLRHRGSDTTTWTVVDLGATVTSHTLTGLTTGRTYTVEIAARNAVGPGAAASVVAVPVGAPSVPQTVKATRGDRMVTVGWQAPATTGGTPITGYVVQTRVYSATSKTWGAWSTRATPGATARSATISSLTNGTKYQVRVQAKNAVATGSSSSALSFVPAAKPAAPGSVKASSTTGKIKVTWTKPATNGSALTSYVVKYSTDKVTWKTLTTRSPSYPYYTWTGGTKGKTYHFRVHAKNGVGTSAPSATVTVKRM